MDLKQIAEKPKLVKLSLDSERILEAYGEPVDFYMYDRQSIPTYLQLSQLENDTGALVDTVKSLVMDESGNRMLAEDDELPAFAMVEMIEKVVGQLGNAAGQTLNR